MAVSHRCICLRCISFRLRSFQSDNQEIALEMLLPIREMVGEHEQRSELLRNWSEIDSKTHFIHGVNPTENKTSTSSTEVLRLWSDISLRCKIKLQNSSTQIDRRQVVVVAVISAPNDVTMYFLYELLCAVNRSRIHSYYDDLPPAVLSAAFLEFYFASKWNKTPKP